MELRRVGPSPKRTEPRRAEPSRSDLGQDHLGRHEKNINYSPPRGPSGKVRFYEASANGIPPYIYTYVPPLASAGCGEYYCLVGCNCLKQTGPLQLLFWIKKQPRRMPSTREAGRAELSKDSQEGANHPLEIDNAVFSSNFTDRSALDFL